MPKPDVDANNPAAQGGDPSNPNDAGQAQPPSGEALNIPEEFHKHPAWQRIMQERDVAMERSKELEENLSSAEDYLENRDEMDNSHKLVESIRRNPEWYQHFREGYDRYVSGRPGQQTDYAQHYGQTQQPSQSPYSQPTTQSNPNPELEKQVQMLVQEKAREKLSDHFYNLAEGNNVPEPLLDQYEELFDSRIGKQLAAGKQYSDRLVEQTFDSVHKDIQGLVRTNFEEIQQSYAEAPPSVTMGGSAPMPSLPEPTGSDDEVDAAIADHFRSTRG